MQLARFQDAFKNCMLDFHQLGNDGGQFRSIFKADYGVNVETRLKVYQDSVLNGLVNAAMAVLPMTQQLLGERFLRQTVRAFVVENLPTQGNLNLYGEGFSDFVREYEPTKNYPYLADFTHLEWLWEKAYYASDDQALDVNELAQVAEDQLPHLRFEFRQSFALLKSMHPLDEIVDVCRAQMDKSDQDQKILSHRGVHLIVFRPELAVELLVITGDEFEFLSALYAQKNMQEAVERLHQLNFDEDLAAVFQKFLQLGIFSNFSVSGENSL